jgi:putative transposase
MQEFRRERHSISRLVVQLVCVTKYRRQVFDGRALDWLREHGERVFPSMQCQLLALDGEADYVHLLVEYPPKHPVSALVNMFKGTSSRLLRKERPDIAACYWKGVLWSPSYFAASAGGAPLSIIRQYVEGQRASSPP